MIKELEQQEKAILENLFAVRRAITKKNCASQNKFWCSGCSIVKYRNGVEYKVALVKPNSFGTRGWKEIQKEGRTFGKARRNIYSDWTLVSSNNAMGLSVDVACGK